MAQEPIRMPISESIINTVVRGGQFVDRQTGQVQQQTAQKEEWFGPLRPIQPSAPETVAGRQLDYPTGYNLHIRPRASEPVSFEQLRALADNLDILRLVIETRKDLVCKMRWQIVPKQDGKDRDSRCDEIEAFLALPDKEHTWSEWLRMLLEDMLVIDAATIYPRLTKGGKLYALEPIDGATIVRKIDQGGRTPIPPEVAYQQYLKGVPAVDYTRDELIYRPRNLRTNRVYGFSPVEQIIMTINIALRRQVSQLQWYTEGSTPDLLFGVPTDWTPGHVREMQAYFNDLLSGDTGARRRATFVPGGITPINTKDGLLKDEYDEWLARIITYAFGLANTPFVKQPNRSLAETAAETAITEGLTPYINWTADLVNFILIRWFGAHDLQLEWVKEEDPDPAQDADVELKHSQRDEIDIRSGVIDINEARVARGLDPLTPEQLEERKPKQHDPLDLGQGQEDREDDDNTPTGGKPGTTSKLEKKKSGPAQPIDRDREGVSLLRDKIQTFMRGFLSSKGEEIAAQVVTAYDELTKADDERAAQIIASLTIDWADLVPEMAEHLIEVTTQGVIAAATQLDITDAGITDLAFSRAEAWAKDRAAELVGMRWIDGELLPNPNPVWSITQTTRDMIYVDVNRAIEGGWSNQRLAAAIRENAAFSESRAMMVARTETAFADVQGNKAFYLEAEELVGPLKWEWVSAGDDKVSEECQMNHGAIREIGKPFPSGATEPPQHPRCRCDVLPIVAK